MRSVALALAVTVLPACGYGSPGHVEVGSGDVVSRSRSVGDFTEVQAGGGIQLELASGPRQVVVTAQPNLVDITTTEVVGSRLTVDTTSGFVSPQGIVVKISTPRLTGIELSGGASASGTVGSAGTLTVRLSGGARTTVSGSAAALDLQASGGAIPALGDLRATNATVDLSGGVVATLDVMRSVKGSASGGVVLTLVRKPATTAVETSGGAVVRTQ
ncbi:hypothetical protein GCM10009817_28260 [Terrabacter lapilli]|uniref:Putative auto-transporter adhesin head GIN domain-containing protein n=2 Tax=Terrabacter lapilli TaxID=436231 RepID=A0ABN2SGA7_9MICO